MTPPASNPVVGAAGIAEITNFLDAELIPRFGLPRGIEVPA